ncbi:uncharacterized protein yc1106_06371 [Curvularia clavata]|uniref:MYND-type domain-containing protein n=1 Tax=Curvularia clavata TaxID=95742 RepID=A0A9Q8ZBK9_CURCL|nr:uncharacterized protein yc1106_06371 [Curvularia clavata]
MSETALKCSACGKTATDKGVVTLNRCSRCKKTIYCNRDCQKADWKTHKKICAQQANAGTAKSNSTSSNSHFAPALNDLEQHVPNPFTRLDQGKYLHDHPKLDVFKLLIDSFRLLQEDDLQFDLKVTLESVCTGAASSIEPFKKYLTLAATRPGLLPPWWTPETQRECEEFGESGAWNSLHKIVTKAEVIAHYGGSLVPVQLRMLADAIVGMGTMGRDGTAMRKMMCEVESGGPEEGICTVVLSMNLGFDGRH